MILIFPDRRTKEHIFYFGLWILAVSRLEDGKLNSRGFLNPWKAIGSTIKSSGRRGFQYRGTFKGSVTLPFRVF